MTKKTKNGFMLFLSENEFQANHAGHPFVID